MCFVWLSEQTAIISLYKNNGTVFITETEFVYCAVQTWYLNAIHFNVAFELQCVPFANETGISLIILPLMRILQRNLKRTTDTFLFISHTTNVLLFKFRCNIFIGVRMIKEMPVAVPSGTHCINFSLQPRTDIT